jgi:hypothetical protein
VDVVAVGLDAPDLERHDHVVGAVERPSAVVGRLDPGREAVVGDQLPGGGRRALGAGQVDVHQHERRVPQGREREQVADQPQGEDVAAGADDRDPGHGITYLM